MVDNQHKQIKGYRDLTTEEIALMNDAKTKAADIGKLIEALNDKPEIDKRWLAIAKTDLQKGFMSLVRAIARPETFVIAFLVMGLSPSVAQQPAPPDKPYTVTLPLSQWQKVADILSEKPFKDVAPIIGALQQQIGAQDQPPKPAPTAPETEPKKP